MSTAPLPPGMPPPPGMPAQKGWWSRNWKWFVPVVVLVVFVLPLATCGGIVFAVMASLKNSDVAKESLARARLNPEVVQKLGTPIGFGMFVGGTINVTPASGRADLAMPLKGPKGGATLFVVARKTAGEWKYQVMQVAISGEPRINLLTDEERRLLRAIPVEESPTDTTE